ncbi:MAG: flagellar assembly peptidoglycan hydrolase FlgJ [Sedimenticola sp.]|jgi:flagellar protein FlgJ|nr:MAG: flagellar assembly peptidoglycan hydrolase FlgJ [Sedimenticola sp.]
MSGISATNYTDLNGLAELKAKAGKDPEGSLDQVAKQFESLLMHQMLKSMRQASLGDGLLDNEQSLFYRDMFDQQLAIHLADGGGMGLAEVIKRQLGGEATTVLPVKSMEDYRRQAVSVQPASAKEIALRTSTDNVVHAKAETTPVQPKAESAFSSFVPRSPQEFVEKLLPMATEAASLLGLKPQALLAQAALESGWGKHVMQFANGDPANNLFGIKADSRWGGDKVTVSTLEYEQGVAVRKKAHFRAYEDYRQSFLDYVDFLKADPRYAKALQSTDDPVAYFQELQKAGYATDPNYAKKISAVLHGNEMSAATERLKAVENQPL